MKPHAHEATRITGPCSVRETSAEPLFLSWGQFEYVYYSGEAAPKQTYPAAGCELFHYLLTQQIKENGMEWAASEQPQPCCHAHPNLFPLCLIQGPHFQGPCYNMVLPTPSQTSPVLPGETQKAKFLYINNAMKWKGVA